MLLKWLRRSWSRFRYVVQLDGDLYLVRYRLLKTPWFGIYLHHILRSDNDRQTHDHPFDYVTIILWGGYTELRPDPLAPSRRTMQYYPPGSIIRRRAEDAHLLKLMKPVWTLFIRGPKRREWGFHMDDGSWLDWQTYHERLG